MERRISLLLERYMQQTASPSEREELFGQIAAGEQRSALEAALQQQWMLQPAGERESFTIREEQDVLQAILSAATLPIEVPVVHRVQFLRTAWFRYAAILLLIAGTATFLYLSNRPEKEITLTTTGKPLNIPPGGNRALLTLSDGSTIVLDSAANGTLARQGGAKIIKSDAGLLTYRSENAGGEALYNTVSTPKGGQYHIRLPDGTNVWLNAASSIRLPVAFTKERTVTITGESYLEVAPDPARPFFVKTGETIIQVLGTSFNVNAYPDEPAIKTTLLQGRVKINNTLLKPGQAYMAGSIVSTNMEQDLAWKSGIFNFNEVSLQRAMRQIAKWYDIEVVYENGIPDITFWGKMQRDLKLSDVLNFLEKMGVHFRMEGRRIIIMP